MDNPKLYLYPSLTPISPKNKLVVYISLDVDISLRCFPEKVYLILAITSKMDVFMLLCCRRVLAGNCLYIQKI